VQDLETLSGSYHTVICLDVLIHYPQDKAAQMIGHLASLAESRLILSFAPKTLALSLLKKIGEFFPGPSKTTRAYQHREADIIKILESSGFSIQRQAMTSTRFYFSRLLEATRR
jgi:magnesium-protoporphyrin O-methyltransferase